ncbi:RdgB/HAM1 family non-canonical purine NTP pyrophosphatase [Actinomyces minihominis]|uniref:RdgB/HAM1 family non-canonical purine NTP pyrophosphatase n=1 Tax=Actinomyces minihominis TaxID=2002838 RepID=UPI000C0688EE|nr:RdgB/HAM1 family non-canonical purine NTP pyrophosphatase [Actinomyces minihominis]
MSTPTLVIATANSHKVEEITALLSSLLPGFSSASVATMADFDVDSPVEDGLTFADNALTKARHLAQQTQLPALADDSGISVAALGGSPGVFSARWAGRHGDDEANLNLLLAQLSDVSDEHRAAKFVCAVALALPDGTEVVTEGTVEGRLARSPRGKGGFGYDPIFIPRGFDRTTAELTPAEKNSISHRSRAIRAMAPHLAELIG